MLCKPSSSSFLLITLQVFFTRDHFSSSRVGVSLKNGSPKWILFSTFYFRGKKVMIPVGYEFLATFKNAFSHFKIDIQGMGGLFTNRMQKILSNLSQSLTNFTQLKIIFGFHCFTCKIEGQESNPSCLLTLQLVKFRRWEFLFCLFERCTFSLSSFLLEMHDRGSFFPLEGTNEEGRKLTGVHTISDLTTCTWAEILI